MKLYCQESCPCACDLNINAEKDEFDSDADGGVRVCCVVDGQKVVWSEVTS